MKCQVVANTPGSSLNPEHSFPPQYWEPSPEPVLARVFYHWATPITLCLFVCPLFIGRVSLFSPGYLGTCSVDQPGLKVRERSACLCLPRIGIKGVWLPLLAIFISKFLIFYFSYFTMSVLLSRYHLHVWCPQRPEKDIGSPSTGVKRLLLAPCGC